MPFYFYENEVSSRRRLAGSVCTIFELLSRIPYLANYISFISACPGVSGCQCCYILKDVMSRCAKVSGRGLDHDFSDILCIACGLLSIESFM